MRLTFPVLVDPEHQVGDRYGVWGYPETFVIDREGRIVERVIGPRDWTAPAVPGGDRGRCWRPRRRQQAVAREPGRRTAHYFLPSSGISSRGRRHV